MQTDDLSLTVELITFGVDKNYLDAATGQSILKAASQVAKIIPITRGIPLSYLIPPPLFGAAGAEDAAGGAAEEQWLYAF